MRNSERNAIGKQGGSVDIMALSLRSKIPLLMVGVVVSLVMLILYTVSSIVNRETAVTLGRNLQDAQSALNEFNELQIRETQLVASLPFFMATLRTNDPTAILQLIKSLQEKMRNNLFIVTDAQGIVLARTDEEEIGVQPFTHPVVRNALEEQVTTGILKVDQAIYRISGIPVLQRKRVIGTLIVGFLIDYAEMERLHTITKSETSFIFENQLAFSTWSGEKRKGLEAQLQRIDLQSSGVTEKGAQDTYFDWAIGDQQYIASLVPQGTSESGSTKGYYLLQQSKNNATRFLGTIQQTILIPGIATGLITALISYFLLQQILVPIDKMKQAAKAITEGNFSIAPIKVGQNNEIGTLVQSFSTMVDGLRSAKAQQDAFVVTLMQTAQSVASAAAALTSSSEQLSTDSKAVTRQAAKVSASGTQNNQNMLMVTQSSGDILTTIKNISQNAQNATMITEKAVKMAESANTIISELNNSSVKVGEVVKFISTIAGQTNLLALNATIEASRAGEAGKGFAVVANEVKDLANQTAKATGEISLQISAIQMDAKSSVTKIMEISTIISEIDEISTTISASVEEQTAMMTEINHNIAEVSKGSQEALQSIHKVATASRSTEAEGEKVKTSSKQLAQMGTNLIDIVNKLKTDSKAGHRSL